MSTQSPYNLRVIRPDELAVYKLIRLEALQRESAFFGSSYEFELNLPEEEWIDRLINPERVVFGLYYNEQELVGITSVIADDEEPGKGYMTQTYIRKEHRGQKLSHFFYEARIGWAKQKGLAYLEIGHRENNLISKSAMLHHGFVYTHRVNKNWPDGTNEDMLYYKLDLLPVRV